MNATGAAAPALPLDSVVPASAASDAAVRAHLDALTKPPGSLGVLEDLAYRLALLLGDPPPPLRRRAVLVFAADHGVARNGVSAYPPAVTAQMVRNIAAGGAAVCAIARAVGADVVLADVGVAADLAGTTGVLHCKVRPGSRDFVEQPALTPAEVAAAMAAGAAIVDQLARRTDIFALGEMGIGNTTSAAALTVLLTGAPVAAVLGRGTGLDDAGLCRKRVAVEAALARVERAHGGRAPSALQALCEVGGLEIAALAGATLAAAARKRVVVTDGFIATAAALAAVRMQPAAREWLFAAHRSVEPGHTVQLHALGLEPLLDLRLRLGEGTGALLALPLLEAAAAILREMATFASAGVSARSDDA